MSGSTLLKLDTQLVRELTGRDTSFDNASPRSGRATLQKLYYVLEELIRKVNLRFEAVEDSAATTIMSSDGSGNLTDTETLLSSFFSMDPDAPEELTVDTNEITVTGDYRIRFHTIDTEGDAASSNLTVVNGGNVGDFLILQAEHNDRTIVCVNGASLRIGANFSLNHTSDKLMAVCSSSGVWDQLARSSNA